MFLTPEFWVFVSFVIFMAIVWKVGGFKTMAGGLDARGERVRAELAEAQRLREDAHRLKAQSEAAAEAHEKALAEARNRAKGIAQETRNNLAAESEIKRKAVEAELGAKLTEAEATIRARTAEAMGNVRGIAADTATAIVERLIGRAPDRATVESALDRTLRS